MKPQKKVYNYHFFLNNILKGQKLSILNSKSVIFKKKDVG